MIVLKPTIIGFSAICSLFHGEGIIVLKPTIIGFSAICPLFLGEGMMVLKPTIIGLPAICPLSPWERARERVSKPQACLFSERYESVIQTRFGF